MSKGSTAKEKDVCVYYSLTPCTREACYDATTQDGDMIELKIAAATEHKVDLATVARAIREGYGAVQVWFITSDWRFDSEQNPVLYCDRIITTYDAIAANVQKHDPAVWALSVLTDLARSATDKNGAHVWGQFLWFYDPRLGMLRRKIRK